ncbi:hypothetical protein Barb4_03327 [Bacteroidales bacterium Barb4]|nr:hypothetical protein Barb4_03327 [Bacteroidales bacterium Barb4]
MRGCIHAVRRNIHFKHIIALNIVITLSRRTGDGIGGKYDNTAVVSANTDFIFGANHAVGLHAAYFRPLDGK